MDGPGITVLSGNADPIEPFAATSDEQGKGGTEPIPVNGKDGELAEFIVAAASYVFLDRGSDDTRTLLIVFGYENQPLGGRAHSTFTSQLDCHRLYLNPGKPEWYQTGIGPVASDWDGIVAFLRRVVAWLGVDRLFCTGSSMGGFAALGFGLELKATGVLAISPELKLDLPGSISRRFLGGVPLRRDDVRPQIEDNEATDIRILVGRRCLFDVAAVEPVASLAHVSVSYLDCDHVVTVHLRDQGLLTEVFERFCAGRTLRLSQGEMVDDGPAAPVPARARPAFTATLAKVAPDLAAYLDGLDNADRAFLTCQLVGLESGGTSNPVQDYQRLATTDKSIFDPRDASMPCLAHPTASVSRLTTLGRSKGAIYVGEGATLRNVLIDASAGQLTVIFGPHCDVFDAVIQCSATGYLFIGMGSTLPKTNLLIQEEGSYIAVGDDCMFSNDVAVRTSDSHGIYDLGSGERINRARPVRVGAHVWIGRHAGISKGSDVRDGAIVGQLSLASGPVPGRALAVGVPARVQRRNVGWSRLLHEDWEAARSIMPYHARMIALRNYEKAAAERLAVGAAELIPLELLSSLLSRTISIAAAERAAALRPAADADLRAVLDDVIRLRIALDTGHRLDELMPH